jgi:acyl carrier protein
LSATSSSVSAPVPEVAAIVDDIAGMIREVVGEDYELDVEITAESSFSEDIEIESIEFVALGDLVQTRYGEKIDLVAWFGELDLDEIIDLTVGELAEFIDACLRQEG